MLDINKTYWVYIASHVYCHIKDEQAFLYNTQTGASIETVNAEIIKLLQSLHERKNLGAICCNGRQIAQSPYIEFITEFREKEMGNMVETSSMPQRPIQMMPILNLQDDIEKLQEFSDRDTGEDVLHYLLELNLYLHDSCNQNCSLCSQYSKQTLCCKTNSGQPSPTFSFAALENIISQIQYGVTGKLNLLGGNIFAYPHFNELPTLLSGFKGQVHIWNHYAHFANYKTLPSNFFYDVVIPSPMQKSLENLLPTLAIPQAKLHFYITDIEEYTKVEEFIEQFSVDNYSIHPIYTKTNLKFFEEYVYADKKDILQSKLSFNQIFAHQKMNTNFFGSLTILPNGDTYANVNSSLLGNIKDDTLIHFINKEMTANTAWRKIRDTPPCNSCLYQYICPSLSNYEIVIGKSNLCHTK